MSKVKTVIKFSAEWCGPCKGYTPIFHSISEKFKDKVEFKELDVEEALEETEKYRIMQVPTTLLLDENGNVLHKATGSLHKDTLDKLILQFLEDEKD